MDFSNSWCYEDQLKPIKFPDVNPADFNDGDKVFKIFIISLEKSYL